MKCRIVIRGMFAVLCAFALLPGVFPAIADEEAEATESPTTADPQPTGDRSESEEAAPPQAAPAGSMAAAAGSRSLQLPADDDGGGARVVITDGNLKQLGEGASFSLTGDSTPAAAAGTTSPIEADAAADLGTATAVPMPGSEIPVSVAAVSAGEPAAPEGNVLNDMISRFLEQQKLVLSLEAQLESFDGTLEEPPPDAHYPNYHSSPQLRPPGVQNPQQAQRDQLAQRLDAERATLEKLREEAQRAGVEL